MAKTEPESVYGEIGARIEKLRVARGLSQSELSRRLTKCRLGRAAVSNIEGGRQRLMLHVLIEIAEVLAVDPGLILSSEPITGPVTVEAFHHRLTALQVSASTIAELRLQLEGSAPSDGSIDT